MSNIDYNLEKQTYTLFINSNDKISGTNNNGYYDIHWDDFLPRDYTAYKMIYSFQTTGGYYGDGTYSSTRYVFSTAKVIMNLQGRNYSYDTSTKSPSVSLGFIQRDLQTSTSSSNCLSCFYLQNPPKTISRPNQNLINIQIVNAYNSTSTNQVLLTDTTTATGGSLSSDMTSWTMICEFIPIGDSKTTFDGKITGL